MERTNVVGSKVYKVAIVTENDDSSSMLVTITYCMPLGVGACVHQVEADGIRPESGCSPTGVNGYFWMHCKQARFYLQRLHQC